MSKQSRKERARAEELAVPDHLPACGKCGDLNDVGDERCRGCNALLYPRGVKPPRMVMVEPDPLPEMQQWWIDRLGENEARRLGGKVA